MKTYRYRDHRGSPIDSLATTVRIANLVALREHFNKTSLDPITNLDKLEFKSLSVGERVWQTSSKRWETHLVILDGCAIGYSDGIIPEEAEDMFDTTKYQVEIDGEPINVSDIDDVVQLRQQLCAAMETIERLDAQSGNTNRIIEDYRNNRIKPVSVLDTVIEKIRDAAEYLEANFGRERGRFTIAYDKLISAEDQLKAAKKEAK